EREASSGCGKLVGPLLCGFPTSPKGISGFCNGFFWSSPTGFQEDVANSKPGAQIGSSVSAEGEHFVDRHRAELIQRVSMVDGVLDMLCGTVLDNEQYQSIRAERSNLEKMRKLYELMPSWNRVCKDQLYQVLKAKHKFLIEELEGK
uniref:CARD domain-containing protein n=1 Tax=Gopherus evgoodei TaxID=1825980 RepID=A0A8C4VSC2_9SAUR